MEARPLLGILLQVSTNMWPFHIFSSVSTVYMYLISSDDSTFFSTGCVLITGSGLNELFGLGILISFGI